MKNINNKKFLLLVILISVCAVACSCGVVIEKKAKKDIISIDENVINETTTIESIAEFVKEIVEEETEREETIESEEKEQVATGSMIKILTATVAEAETTKKIPKERKEQLVPSEVMKKNIFSNSTMLEVSLKGNEKYYDMSAIKDGHAYLYIVNDKDNKKDFTIAVNAGHGVKGGSKYKTYSHPDMTPKLSGGTNGEGSVMSSAISEGTVLDNGVNESDVNLMMAIKLLEKLLNEGYNVLMIREDNDSRLDNVARTILANAYSNMHISLHLDSTDSDKGAFVILPLQDKKYLSMEPVKFHHGEDNLLGEMLIKAFMDGGEKVWQDGKLYMDLTQISYSTVPSIDIELGDKKTVINDNKINSLTSCILNGINEYYNYLKMRQ